LLSGHLDVKSEQQAKADIDRYDKLVQQQPDFNSYKQRGINYFGAEQYDKAIADLSKAIDESQPPDQQALIYRAHAYILTGQWAKGLAAHKQYLQIYNSSWDRWFAHRGMGICLYHQKQYQAAADSFTEALKEDADMEYLEKQELLYDRARANEHLGKADLAAKDRKQVSAKNTKWWLK